MKDKINAMAAGISRGMITFLRELVSIPSFSGKEGKIARRIQEEMERLGYDKVWTDPLGNVIGQIGSGPRIVAIDGHCDTVGVGNRENWKQDPFSGAYRDGMVYGRGAVDQKGGLASAVYAGRLVKEIGAPDEITLLVVASVLEEDFEGFCWQHIVEETGIRPEVVILTEPSDLQLKIGQRGRLECKVQAQGASCHGSAPERGDNAVYRIAPIIKEVENFNARLKSDSVLGKGTITVTDVCSEAPSLCAVPDSAVLHLDRRLTEGETMASCIQEIEGFPSVSEAGAEVSVPEYRVQSYTGETRNLRAYYPMWLMERDHPTVQKAVGAYRSQFGSEPDVGVWQFSTNGVTTKGKYDIPTIGFGPGEEAYAHTSEEKIRDKDLVQAVAFYTAFLYHWIGST